MTNTTSLSYSEYLPHMPQITIDAYYLISHFYKNSPPLMSRALGIGLKYTVQEVFLKDNVLTKDGNPVVTNVIREGTNVLPLSYNAYKRDKHTAGRNETLEGIYLAGQQSRFLCKAIPQYLSGGDVTHARLLNIACDSPSIMANHLSKISQHDPNKTIYWFWKEENTTVENVWVGGFLVENTPLDFIKASVITAGVKAIILDQIGDVLKIVKSLPLITNPYNYIVSYEKTLIEVISSSTVATSIDQIVNVLNHVLFTDQYIEFLEKGLETSTMHGLLNNAFSILNAAVPDLFITGVFMLSTSNDIVETYNTATPSEQNAIIFNGVVLFTSKYSLTYVLALTEESVIYFPSLLPTLLDIKELLLTFATEVPAHLPYLSPLLLPLLSDTCYNYLKESAIETTEYLYLKEQELVQGIIDLPSNTMDFITGKEASYSDEL